MSKSARRVAFAAVFTAMSVITNVFTLFLGGGAVGISFTYAPVFLSGVFFGPFIGFSVGVIGDILGCLIQPQGPWIPFITVSAGFIGLIPGLLFSIPAMKILHNIKAEVYLKIFIGMILVLIFCTAGLNTFGLWLTYSAGKKTFWVYLFGRLPFQTTTLAINFILITILYPFVNNLFTKNFHKN